MNIEDHARYQPLVALSAAHTTELDFDTWMWATLYTEGTGEIPGPEQIAEITHLRGVSPEGYASSDIALMARLADGRWATCVAWSDTSGFDCRGAVDWRINDTREQAIDLGLDQETRALFGLNVTEDGA